MRVFSSVSSLALIGANLIPLAGVLFLGWETGELLLLFWGESAVIGLFNLARMAKVGGWLALFMGLFFILHYGGFMAGHLLFIYGFMDGFASGDDVSLAQLWRDS